MKVGAAIAAAGAVAVLAGCGQSSTTPDSQPATRTGSPARAPEQPPTSGVLDYQLGGNSDTVRVHGTRTPVTVVVRDRATPPLGGGYSVCYVNGFQTQPDEADLWRDHRELLLTGTDGAPVVDPAWPDEMVLDPSTPEQREGILEILGPMITGCADDGYDAVEIDNLDTADRFPAIDGEGARALARSFVDLAHGRGLAVAQKNAAEHTRELHDDVGFDLAVAESCAAYDECAAYTDVYGDAVLHVEYTAELDEAGTTFAQACERDDRSPLMVLRDRELVAPGEPGYRYRAC